MRQDLFDIIGPVMIGGFFRQGGGFAAPLSARSESGRLTPFIPAGFADRAFAG